MLQPFVPFKVEYIDKLISLNKKHIVSQTYKRGSDLFAQKTNILFSDYDDPGLAKIHYDAMMGDKYAALIDLTNPKHKEKITAMLQPTSVYTVYWAVVQNTEALKRSLDLRFKDNIRKYIQQHTNWRIGSDEVVQPNLQVIYGELFLIIKRGSQRIRVKFEEIEKT